MTIRSMTGFGASRREDAAAQVGVELKSVNGRFLKASIKSPPLLNAREPAVETVLKREIRRGSVTVGISFRRTALEQLVTVNEDVARAYQAVFQRIGLAEQTIPSLPGVIGSGSVDPLSESEWQLVEETLTAALEQLVAMRVQEGEGLARALGGQLDTLAQLAAQITVRAPLVVVEYRDKLRERIDTLLADTSTVLDEQTLAREVAIYADRSDITEELERLRLHIEHARKLLAGGGEAGRRLEFLAQEMLREVNTIGSKSSDPQVSQLVVDLKAEVDRIKEQVANVE